VSTDNESMYQTQLRLLGERWRKPMPRPRNASASSMVSR
jgi:hypothetical protein